MNVQTPANDIKVMRRNAEPQADCDPVYMKDDQDLHDELARAASVYGFRIFRMMTGRQIEIETSEGPCEVTDYATNSPFGLNRREEVLRGAIRAILHFGALHASIATARGQTSLSYKVAARLVQMKGANSQARTYPTTLSANIAAAHGFAKQVAVVVAHPHAHATMQLALRTVFPTQQLIKTTNTAEVARAVAKTARGSVLIVEDGLYSMGQYANFSALRDFLGTCNNGWVWLDDAHSVGMRGACGRGEALEQMADHTDTCVVTGSFGKAFGSVGGFMVGPTSFVNEALKTSVPDRFSCNLDVAGLGAIDAAMDLLSTPGEIERLQSALAQRLEIFDQRLRLAGVKTAQEGSTIAFRVVPFTGPEHAIEAAGHLLWADGLLTTPVYHPTISRGTGAIRMSFSALHDLDNVKRLADSVVRSLANATVHKKAS